jgi:hypothetical protein
MSLLAADLLFAYDGYVDITNNTGYTIYGIYVSHSDNETWGDNMLVDEVLKDGGTYRVYLRAQPSEFFDILVEEEDGDTYSFYQVDVDKQDIVVTLDDLDTDENDSDDIPRITLNGPGGNFNGYIDVINDTGYTMYYLYIKQKSENWNSDLLGDYVLENGATFKVNLKNFPESIFDVRLEDEEGDAYSLFKIDATTDDAYLTLENMDQ